ncbi:phosphoadenosine phosphosulfate reductase family domain containing protein [Babesia ovis]|uniref:FAD synthase n=1 Tax=Babesia ovis TaxID=5869 RepID=A0A9W5TES3_BABOV|nr:phosphoadenosine phosphosulfate reductase family domain containing protein [Babesia ovis]
MSRAWDKLESFGRILSTPMQSHILRDSDSDRLATLLDRTIQLLWRSYSDIGYDNIYLSFNGGKDSVAVLHLHRLAAHSAPKSCGIPDGCPLNVVFFKNPNERLFPDITEFMTSTAAKYNFSVRVIEASWNQGIPQLSSGSKKGYIIGCRATDFDSVTLSEIEEGCVEDVKFHRIHPILHWGYGDVWNFLRLYSLEYCELYDAGYTSIGSTDDTIPNPYLRKPDGTYAPAYTLENWALERYGRTKSSRKTEGSS